MKNNYHLRMIALLAVLSSGFCFAQQSPAPNNGYVDQLYPNLAAGILTYAKVGSLPDNILIKSNGVEIKTADIEQAISRQPEQIRTELKKNAFFVLEQEATGQILKKNAGQNAPPPANGDKTTDDNQRIKTFFDDLTKEIKVTDGDIETFYKENEGTFCGTPLEKVRKQIETFVLQDKKQRFVDQYIRNYGQNMEIIVSDSWTKLQAETAADNPLDKARTSGKMTLAVFSAASCCGPDKMKPVLAALKNAKAADTLNILYLEAKQEQILAARYQVRSIPTQIFFDKTGREVYRHVGFFSADDIEKQLAKMGES